MSQRLIAGESVELQGDTIDLNGPITSGPITFPARNGAYGAGLTIGTSSSAFSNGGLVDSRNVVPTGTHGLYITRINNIAYWTFQQVDGSTAFTCGATNSPLWLASWPLTSRPTNSNPSYMPLTVQKSTGERETMFMVVSPNGDITINHGNSTLFTSGNLLYMGGSGSFAVEGY